MMTVSRVSGDCACIDYPAQGAGQRERSAYLGHKQMRTRLVCVEPMLTCAQLASVTIRREVRSCWQVECCRCSSRVRRHAVHRRHCCRRQRGRNGSAVARGSQRVGESPVEEAGDEFGPTSHEKGEVAVANLGRVVIPSRVEELCRRNPRGPIGWLPGWWWWWWWLPACVTPFFHDDCLLTFKYGQMPK
jgi:hypothetical protein